MKDGGPAFPNMSQWSDKTFAYTHSGMSLRDYFAAKALQGILARPVTADDGFRVDDYSVYQIAYWHADAMLKARGE